MSLRIPSTVIRVLCLEDYSYIQDDSESMFLRTVTQFVPSSGTRSWAREITVGITW
jgi:hypothetical protein